MHHEVLSLMCFGSERATLHTPNIQLHCGVQDRLWVLAGGLSGNTRALVLKECYSAQGSRQEECCSFVRNKNHSYKEGTMKITQFSVWWLFICSFSSSVEVGFQLVPAGGCILSSCCSVPNEHKEGSSYRKCFR